MLKALLVKQTGEFNFVEIENLSDILPTLRKELFFENNIGTERKLFADDIEQLKLVSLEAPIKVGDMNYKQKVGILALDIQSDESFMPLSFGVRGPHLVVIMEKLETVYDVSKGQTHVIASLPERIEDVLEKLLNTFFHHKPTMAIADYMSQGYFIEVSDSKGNTVYVGTDINQASKMFDVLLAKNDKEMDEIMASASTSDITKMTVSRLVKVSIIGEKEYQCIHSLRRTADEDWEMSDGVTLFSPLFATEFVGALNQ